MYLIKMELYFLSWRKNRIVAPECIVAMVETSKWPLKILMDKSFWILTDLWDAKTAVVLDVILIGLNWWKSNIKNKWLGESVKCQMDVLEMWNFKFRIDMIWNCLESVDLVVLVDVVALMSLSKWDFWIFRSKKFEFSHLNLFQIEDDTGSSVGQIARKWCRSTTVMF